MELVLPKPGKYVLAVSGGVDSVCLLDFLSKHNEYELIVAHFDHGIRNHSDLDLAFVKKLAQKYGLRFAYARGKLGPEASEAAARAARYAFLHDVLKQFGAEGIIVAHHQDDRLETLFINIIRGTSPRGLASIRETKLVKRPLLKVSKAQLKSYALKNKLTWREDETNGEDIYLRNRIRKRILPRLNNEQRKMLLKVMERQVVLNREMDRLIKPLLDPAERRKLRRRSFDNLDFKESEELIASWLRENNLFNFDRRTIERLTLAIKTKRPGTRLDVSGGATVDINKEYLALSLQER